MICAGYWMEDMQSYLVTYDREDPFSNFRCWVSRLLFQFIYLFIYLIELFSFGCCSVLTLFCVKRNSFIRFVTDVNSCTNLLHICTNLHHSCTNLLHSYTNLHHVLQTLR